MSDNIRSANNVDMTGFKNLIINGNHRVNNRNTGSITVLPRAANVGAVNDWNKFVTDRWIIRNYSTETGKNFQANITYINGDANATSCSGMLGNAPYMFIFGLAGKKATHNVCALTHIEDITRFENRKISVQFKARYVVVKDGVDVPLPSNITFSGKFHLRIFMKAGPLNPSLPIYNKQITIGMNNDIRTYKFEEISIPSFAKALQDNNYTGNTSTYARELSALRFELIPLEGEDTTAIANAGFVINFDIGQIQMEFGSSCTDFEDRPLAIEETLCERYYVTGTYMSDQLRNSQSRYIDTVSYPVSLRVVPVFKLRLDTSLCYAAEWTANSLAVTLNTTKNFGLTAITAPMPSTANKTLAVIYEADADFLVDF